MKYAFLLYVEEHLREDPEVRAGMEKWMAYGEELHASGVGLAGGRLEGLATATTVRVRDGETLISDGPFAETKEMLGGFYVVDLPDHDAALDWAARVPSAPYGSIEIRPVLG
jgi:hypothetical protein